MSQDQETPLDIYTAESWEYSRNYASLLGEIPNSFGSTVRSLVSDHEKNAGALSAGTRFLAARLIRSQSLKASFYYAAQTFKPDVIAQKDSISDKDLVDIFTPYEIACLLGTIYLYKKAKKLCDPGEFAFIAPALIKEIDIAGAVGAAISGIGLGNGLLSCGMRYIACMTFLKHNTKHFQEFRRLLKNQKTIFSLKHESEYFGCTVPQIASIFLQTLGFGIEFANRYAMDFSNPELLTKTVPTSSPFKVTQLWIRSLTDKAAVPDVIHDTKYYPKNAEATNRLIEIAKAEPTGWLDKNSDDINPEKTPKLAVNKRAVAAASATEETPAEEELAEKEDIDI